MSSCSLTDPLQYRNRKEYTDCSYANGQKIGIILFLLTILAAWVLYRQWTAQGIPITSTFWMWMLGWFVLWVLILPYLMEYNANATYNKSMAELEAYQRLNPTGSYQDFVQFINQQKQVDATSRIAKAQMVQGAALAGMAGTDIYRLFR